MDINVLPHPRGEPQLSGSRDFPRGQGRDGGPNGEGVGAGHEALGHEAEERGRTVSATRAFQAAAWCYHLGKFLWFEDQQLHNQLRDLSVSVYRRALARLDPPAERLEIPF